jgi:hypothetical protein
MTTNSANELTTTTRGTNVMTNTIEGRPRITNDPDVDKVLASARQTIGRLTAAWPRETDDEKQRLLVVLRLLEQAYIAGLQIGLGVAKEERDNAPMWGLLIARAAQEVTSWKALGA